VEFQLLARRSFQEFIEVCEYDLIPDARTIWVFKERLREEKLDKINYYIKCDESISFDIEYTINIGLIVNEIISNSLKHAFCSKDFGNIFVELKEENDLFKLVIEDDGVGINNNFNNSKTLGINLIYSFVNQINGKIEIESEKGSKFVITFRYNKNGQY